jgi:hypothetical protein
LIYEGHRKVQIGDRGYVGEAFDETNGTGKNRGGRDASLPTKGEMYSVKNRVVDMSCDMGILMWVCKPLEPPRRKKALGIP